MKNGKNMKTLKYKLNEDSFSHALLFWIIYSNMIYNSQASFLRYHIQQSTMGCHNIYKQVRLNDLFISHIFLKIIRFFFFLAFMMMMIMMMRMMRMMMMMMMIWWYDDMMLMMLWCWWWWCWWCYYVDVMMLIRIILI